MSLPAPTTYGPIGLGCVTFGREIDEAASFVLMDHAHQRGIRLFDTAAAYAAGESERIVGAWLASRRPPPDSVVVATKLIPPFDPGRIEALAALSLARLGRIDLLYLHKWDATADDPAVLRALGGLVRAGRVGGLAASNFTSAQLAQGLALQSEMGLPRYRALQNNHNAAVRDIDDETRRLCRENDVAIVTYSPLGAGFLTGKHRDGVAKGTRFDLIPGHQRIYFKDEAYRRLDRLEAIARRTGIEQTKLALAWALHQPGHPTVLIGGRLQRHIDQAFDALAYNDPTVFAELSEDA